MKTEREPISKRLRFKILERDNFACQYCGAKANGVQLEVDHIIPVSKGGTNDEKNLITSCRNCNGIEGKWSSESTATIYKMYVKLLRENYKLKEDSKVDFLQSVIKDFSFSGNTNQEIFIKELQLKVLKIWNGNDENAEKELEYLKKLYNLIDSSRSTFHMMKDILYQVLIKCVKKYGVKLNLLGKDDTPEEYCRRFAMHSVFDRTRALF